MNTYATIAQAQPLPPPADGVAGPIDPTAAVFALLFMLDEILPFLGGRFKKFNGVFQSLSLLIRMAKPMRKEDEQVEALRQELAEMRALLGTKPRPHSPLGSLFRSTLPPGE